MDSSSPSRPSTPLPTYNRFESLSIERSPPLYKEFEAYDGMGMVFFVAGFCELFGFYDEVTDAEGDYLVLPIAWLAAIAFPVMRRRATIEDDNREISLRIIAHERVQRRDRAWATRSAAALAIYLLAMAGTLYIMQNAQSLRGRKNSGLLP